MAVELRADVKFDLQMGAWKLGDETNTSLTNKDGEVVATRDTVKEKEVTGTSRSVTIESCHY